jgi:hypothetical protein
VLTAICLQRRKNSLANFERNAKAGWLSPVPLEPKRQALRAMKTARRVSNNVFLALAPGEYRALLDCIARHVRTDKRGSMPAELEPIIERLAVSSELWIDCAVNFRRWFRSSVGRPKSIPTHTESRGLNRPIRINL